MQVIPLGWFPSFIDFRSFPRPGGSSFGSVANRCNALKLGALTGSGIIAGISSGQVRPHSAPPTRNSSGKVPSFLVALKEDAVCHPGSL